MKPRLTEMVLRGLQVACSNSLAGDVADLTGCPRDNPSVKNQHDWDCVEAAEKWVQDMRTHRRRKRALKGFMP